jgi:hypothetical protein
MSERYNLSSTKRNSKNKVVFRTVLYPKIERRADDVYIYTVLGDRLDLLAFKYYKDQTLWWIIAQANLLGSNASFVLEPGKQIRIPADPDLIINDYITLNNIK